MAVGNKGWKVGKRGPKGLVGPRGPPGESAGSAGPNLVSSGVNITATDKDVIITALAGVVSASAQEINLTTTTQNINLQAGGSVNIAGKPGEGYASISGLGVNVNIGGDGCYIQSAMGGVYINTTTYAGGTVGVGIQPGGTIDMQCSLLLLNGQHMSTMPYIPANSSQWGGTPPTTVTEAIDRLVTAVLSLGVAP